MGAGEMGSGTHHSDDDEESTLGWALLPEVMEDAGPEDEHLAAVVEEYVTSQAFDQVELESNQERSDDRGNDQQQNRRVHQGSL